jgi:hypothetical protein
MENGSGLSFELNSEYLIEYSEFRAYDYFSLSLPGKE